MALAIVHPFVSPIPDEGEPGIVGPNDWNATHLITQETARILGRVTLGSGTTEELTAAQVKTLLEIIAADVAFTPAGGISATDVQAAIEELDAEKASDADLAATDAVLAAHIADVANPHNVTKTQVGLGNVTDDAQLKRAAGDFATFTEKTTPVDADIALIEDSAAAGAKKWLSWANIKATLKTYFDTLYAALAGSISQSFAVSQLEVGHTSDTTLSRLAAGILGVEGNALSLGLNGIQVLTASGTYTPTAGTRKALVFLQAAGGGGGGVGTSAGTGRGGSGGAGETRGAAVDISGNETVTIGAAGTGASAGNNAGGTASDSTFGALITSKGGLGGGGSTGATNGTSGTTPTGSGGVAIPTAAVAATTSSSMTGGCTFFGLGGQITAIDAVFAAANGEPGRGPGGGGTGGLDTGTTARPGQAGFAGLCLVIEFK